MLTTIALALLSVITILQIFILFRKPPVDFSPLTEYFERIERSVREEISKNREEWARVQRDERAEIERMLRSLREETGRSLKDFNDSTLKGLKEMSELLKKDIEIFAAQLGRLTESNEKKLELVKATIAEQLQAIQQDNSRQLEEMRKTVDEKLQGTLEKRLGESFRQVSERLEAVARGLGEMQTLATGVGDLKRVLTNVKARGTFGEVQLGALLEEVLTAEQYAKNVSTKNNSERVEFAVKLPGPAEEKDSVLWMPIDAKFPIEDYQRLVEAQEKGDGEGQELAARQLEIRIKACARDINEKYLNPPQTTDFGVLFLPTEGLFAEALRRPGLSDTVQRECHVVLAGPTTLWSILNSLQMGFKTLAIQKRSSEVWKLLSAVKTEWGRYGEVLEKVQKKLQEATDQIDKAHARTRAIGRKLKGVEALPAAEAHNVLMPGDDAPEELMDAGVEVES